MTGSGGSTSPPRRHSRRSPRHRRTPRSTPPLQLPSPLVSGGGGREEGEATATTSASRRPHPHRRRPCLPHLLPLVFLFFRAAGDGEGGVDLAKGAPLAEQRHGHRGRGVGGAEAWYIDQFSRSLSVEYKQYGVDVQCQIPLYVATKMSPVKGDSPFIPSPEDYAKAALRCIGYEARCVPYWRHTVQWSLASLVPDAALNHWRLQIGIRKRNEMKALHSEKMAPVNKLF
ncbi:hypothetical protein U9M48_020298 [Paspalum notatum var. saurae]|uniref:Uncharacterized protein n=1 Tax=Paspalum notatum var. saurae TaxID=547442 RepID=A0AAQ3TGM1_PASNO